MEIRRETIGDITVLRAIGSMSIGVGDVALREAVKDLVAAGRPKVVLDLSQVSYMDSAAFGQLVSSYTSLHKEGGDLVLAAPTQKIFNILQVTQLVTVFNITDTVDEAVALLRA